MMLWVAIPLTILSVALTVMMGIGRWARGRRAQQQNHGASREWLLAAVWLLVAIVWGVYVVSAPAHADHAARESILPPGMLSLSVELTRDPDVRCVVSNCFAPPARRRGESQRRFERRLLSPKGPPGRLE